MAARPGGRVDLVDRVPRPCKSRDPREAVHCHLPRVVSDPVRGILGTARRHGGCRLSTSVASGMGQARDRRPPEGLNAGAEGYRVEQDSTGVDTEPSSHTADRRLRKPPRGVSEGTWRDRPRARPEPGPAASGPCVAPRTWPRAAGRALAGPSRIPLPTGLRTELLPNLLKAIERRISLGGRTHEAWMEARGPGGQVEQALLAASPVHAGTRWLGRESTCPARTAPSRRHALRMAHSRTRRGLGHRRGVRPETEGRAPAVKVHPHGWQPVHAHLMLEEALRPRAGGPRHDMRCPRLTAHPDHWRSRDRTGAFEVGMSAGPLASIRALHSKQKAPLPLLPMTPAIGPCGYPCEALPSHRACANP